MAIDNFEIIKSYIKESDPGFDSDSDKYYTVEVIIRRKDNPRMKNDSHTIKLYHINKVSDLDDFKNEIITMCMVFNARAYISVNHKSYEQVTKNTLVLLASRIANNDYKKSYSIFQSCSGKYIDSSNKRWVVDCDKEDADILEITTDEYVNKLSSLIEECIPNETKVIKVIPTVTGKHIICKPFNVIEFENKVLSAGMLTKVFNKPIISKDSIKKNQPTLLYF